MTSKAKARGVVGGEDDWGEGRRRVVMAPENATMGWEGSRGGGGVILVGWLFGGYRMLGGGGEGRGGEGRGGVG